MTMPKTKKRPEPDLLALGGKAKMVDIIVRPPEVDVKYVLLNGEFGAYNREINEHHVAEMRTNWPVHREYPVILLRGPNGVWYILDGQHRFRFIKTELGDEPVVLHALMYEKVADLPEPPPNYSGTRVTYFLTVINRDGKRLRAADIQRVTQVGSLWMTTFAEVGADQYMTLSTNKPKARIVWDDLLKAVIRVQRSINAGAVVGSGNNEEQRDALWLSQQDRAFILKIASAVKWWARVAQKVWNAARKPNSQTSFRDYLKAHVLAAAILIYMQNYNKAGWRNDEALDNKRLMDTAAAQARIKNDNPHAPDVADYLLECLNHGKRAGGRLLTLFGKVNRTHAHAGMTDALPAA